MSCSIRNSVALIPLTLQFNIYCILFSVFLCCCLWFTYPVTCFCYPCDPLAWPFNPQLFRLHPLRCSVAVPSAAPYPGFSFQHVTTNNCFIPPLIPLSPVFHVSSMYISSLTNMMHSYFGCFPDHPLEDSCIFQGF